MTETTQQKIQRLLDASRKDHADSGTEVRCPVCGVGVHKFCIGNVAHVERIALANAK